MKISLPCEKKINQTQICSIHFTYWLQIYNLVNNASIWVFPFIRFPFKMTSSFFFSLFETSALIWSNIKMLKNKEDLCLLHWAPLKLPNYMPLYILQWITQMKWSRHPIGLLESNLRCSSLFILYYFSFTVSLYC